jgi:hypothetical protein
VGADLAAVGSGIESALERPKATAGGTNVKENMMIAYTMIRPGSGSSIICGPMYSGRSFDRRTPNDEQYDSNIFSRLATGCSRNKMTRKRRGETDADDV